MTNELTLTYQTFEPQASTVNQIFPPDKNISIQHAEIIKSSGIDLGSTSFIIDITISYASGITSGVIANYIYNSLSKRNEKTGKILINGIKVKLDPGSIEIAIEKIQSNSRK